MLSEIVKPGQLMELQALHKNPVEEDTEEQQEQGGEGKEVKEEKGKVYRTKVFDILSEDKLEIMMPLERGQLILLTVDEEYDLWFFVENKNLLYQCHARVLDRYKSNNVYIAVMELTTNLKRHQRREYYRFDCLINMQSRKLEPEEIAAVEQERFYLVPDIPLRRGIIVDISGGGLRFTADYQYTADALIYCNYYLDRKVGRKQYHLIGRILSVRELEDRPGKYEHRMQYVNMDVDDREEIIKYIFEEERKQRHKAKGK